MRNYNTLPADLDIDYVMERAQDEMFGLDNPGFCLECGAEREGCEPDARNYECYDCGEHAVFGASEVMMMFGGF